MKHTVSIPSDPPQPAKTRPLRHQALDLLARREHASHELGTKLLAKGGDRTEIETVLTQLQQEGLLSDARFAEMRCRQRREAGFGPLHVSSDLLARGLSRQLITEVIDAESELWLSAARHAKQKRFGPGRPRDPATQAKWMRFLHARGFTQRQIRHALHDTEAEED